MASRTQIADRDLAVLRVLARYEVATYDHLAAALGCSVGALRVRFGKVADRGLVQGRDTYVSASRVWTATALGRDLADLAHLPQTPLDVLSLHARLPLTTRGLAFEAAGETVVTRAEIMALAAEAAAEGTPDPWAVNLARAGRPVALHRPDMVLQRDLPSVVDRGTSIAIEVLGGRVHPTHLRRVLRAYSNSQVFGGILFYVSDTRTISSVLAAATATDMQDRVEVQPREAVYRETPRGPFTVLVGA